ncbi:MAG: shikimate dehydrogenase [Bacteroidetes bacterium]|nr:shikimate dehydrogenase [Bacteroidota bacterium]
MSTYGLIGKSLKHSFSKDFFTKKFDAEGLRHSYENFEIQDISEIIAILKTDISGLNVTIPYKEAVIPYLDKLSREAEQIGAVNTIVLKDGIAIGHNTDAHGFQQSIKPFLTLEHDKALIIGTGGASKAVAFVLENIGLEVLYISRNPQKENQFGYSEINEHMLRACKCVVNTAPVGTWPNIDDCIAFPFEFLTDKHLVIDLIYNPEETQFLKLSKEQGAATLNGLSMLKHQALRAWELWM